MEKVKAFSFFLSLDHLLCQFIIFFTDLRHIFLSDGIFLFFIGYYRLHRNLVKAQVCQMKDIL